MFLDRYDPEQRRRISSLCEQLGEPAPLELELHLHDARRTGDGDWIIATESGSIDLKCDESDRVTRLYDETSILVNSTVSAFLESLSDYKALIDAADRGEFEESGDRGAIRALEQTLRSRDPEAFRSRGSFWPRVIQGLLDLAD